MKLEELVGFASSEKFPNYSYFYFYIQNDLVASIILEGLY